MKTDQRDVSLNASRVSFIFTLRVCDGKIAQTKRLTITNHFLEILGAEEHNVLKITRTKL